MKRIFAIMLLLALALSAAVPVAFAEDGKQTISYWAFWTGDVKDDDYCVQYVEENMDVDIEVVNIDAFDLEAVGLMLASGNMPDMAWIEQYHPIGTFIDQGLIRQIPLDMVRQYAPSYYALMQKFPSMYARCSVQDDPNSLWGLSDLYLSRTDQVSMYCYFLRYDWIKNLGLADKLGVNVEQVSDRVYVAKTGLTPETFKMILDGFVHGDPDQNGIDDTVGLSHFWWKFMSMAGLVGDLNKGWNEYSGGAEMWYAHPDFKKVLAYTRDLYGEGLILPDIFTAGANITYELCNTGKSGVFAETVEWLDSWASIYPPLTMLNNFPDSEILVVTGVTDEDGRCKKMAQTFPADHRLYVGADVDDAKLQKILEVFEWAHFSSDDTLATLWFGEKGVDWEWGEGGNPKLLTGVANGERGTQIFVRNLQFGKAYEWVIMEPLFKDVAKYCVNSFGGDQYWCKDLAYQYKDDLYMATNANAIESEYKQDWMDIYNNYFMRVIRGQADLEGDWDAYIEELNAAGYADFKAEIDALPPLTEMLAALELE